MKIEANTTITLNYVLKANDGTVLEATSHNGPVTILYGHNMFPGPVEEALKGKEPGDQINVKLAPGEGFGEKKEDLIITVPRSNFREPEKVVSGGEIIVNDGTQDLRMSVVSVTDDTVELDGNHPYAGMETEFELGVIAVKTTTEEDLTLFYGNSRAEENSGCSGGCDSCESGC